MREASEKTQLRNAKRELAETRRKYAEAASERREFMVRCAALERELSDWRRRFDALLGIVGSRGDSAEKGGEG